MPSDARRFTVEDAHRYISTNCFRGGTARRVGLEIEWLVRYAEHPRRVVPFELVRPAAADAARDVSAAAFSFEPGGQAEVSTAPAPDVQTAIRWATDAQLALASRLTGSGLELTGIGLDPERDPPRVVFNARYDAMEAAFAYHGAAGTKMMRKTAGIQVNLDFGAAIKDGWRLAHTLGPVLTAMFANSPVENGYLTGCKSSRMATWFAMAPNRTAPAGASPDPEDDWARYALAADVILMHKDAGTAIPLSPGFTFAHWIAEGHEEGFPDESDFAYHLTTLFPPVRPRGWIELRMIDSLPDDLWPVACALATVLIYDDDAAAAALEACPDDPSMWITAARMGLQDERLARAAQVCARAALGSAERWGIAPDTVDAMERFIDRYVSAVRCPADDIIERVS